MQFKIEFILVMAVLSSLTGYAGAGAFVCYSKGSLMMYDSADQICCNGTLYDRSKFRHDIDCCNVAENGTSEGRLYNKENETCCEGSIYNTWLLQSSGMKCCESKTTNKIYNIDSETELCCEGILYTNVDRDTYCCGNLTYQLFGQRCCQGQNGRHQVYAFSSNEDCCADKTFNMRTHECVDDVILPRNTRMCDGNLINIRTQTCCEGKIHNLIGASQYNRCCGRNVYNPTLKDCNKRQIVEKGNLWCQNEEYNPKHQLCCDGVVHDNIYGDKALCCGKALINTSQFRCCGMLKYDPLNDQCCGVNILHKSEVCCGGERLDTTLQVCCPQILEREEHAIYKAIHNHTDCCPSPKGGQSYSRIQSYCSFEGNVMSKNRNASKCGRKDYDPKKDLCCNYIVFEDARTSGKLCCNPGASVYNPKKQVCCDSVPVNGKSCRPSCKASCGVLPTRKFLRKLRCRSKVYVIKASKRKRKSRSWNIQYLLIKGKRRHSRFRSKTLRLPKKCDCLPKYRKLFLLSRRKPRRQLEKAILSRYNPYIASEIRRRQKKSCIKVGS